MLTKRTDFAPWPTLLKLCTVYLYLLPVPVIIKIYRYVRLENTVRKEKSRVFFFFFLSLTGGGGGGSIPQNSSILATSVNWIVGF